MPCSHSVCHAPLSCHVLVQPDVPNSCAHNEHFIAKTTLLHHVSQHKPQGLYSGQGCFTSYWLADISPPLPL
ncbi:hypothetical protein M758_6G187600 [Ceratodon purpureus]|nr:hypothetical protein M758_6G187600 [Ceratodon purpureus]